MEQAPQWTLLSHTHMEGKIIVNVACGCTERCCGDLSWWYRSRL